jgi:hypothetical protein
MAYYRGKPRSPRPHLVTVDDIGQHVTIKVRNARGGSPIFASGIVKAVTAQCVVLTRTVYPTGPWDRWEAHDVDSDIAHGRIISRA